MRGGRKVNGKNYWLDFDFWKNLYMDVVHPWIRLVRAANLLTVFGDTLAGACLAAVLTKGRLPMMQMFDVVIISLFMYVYGILQNDICDLSEDKLRRRERPLAKGEITVFSAIFCSVLLGGASLLLAFLNGHVIFFISLALFALINMYNIILKHQGLQGALCMGLCRGFDFLLGAAIVQISLSVILPAVSVTAYILMVTVLASTEYRRTHFSLNPLYLAAPFLIGWLVVFPFVVGRSSGLGIVCSFVCLAAAAFFAVMHIWNLYGQTVSPDRTQRCIGRLLGCLIPWQACWIVLYEPQCALLLMALFAAVWGLYLFLGRKIRQS